MKTQEKLIVLQESFETTRASSKNDIDTERVSEIVRESIARIDELEDAVCEIKAEVEGVKWYNLLKLASIVGAIIKQIKLTEWGCDK